MSKSLLAQSARRVETMTCNCTRSSTDRMVVSEAAYPGSIPGGRTSWKTAGSIADQGMQLKSCAFAAPIEGRST